MMPKFNTRVMILRLLSLCFLCSTLISTSWSKTCTYEVEIKNQLVNFLSDSSEKSVLKVEVIVENVGVKTSYDYRGDGGIQSNIAVPLTIQNITNKELYAQNNKLFFISRDFPASMYPYFLCPAPKSVNITVGVDGSGQKTRKVNQLNKQSNTGVWTSPNNVIKIKLL